MCVGVDRYMSVMGMIACIYISVVKVCVDVDTYMSLQVGMSACRCVYCISVVGVCVGVLQECACMWSECVHVDVDMYTSAGSWSECMYIFSNYNSVPF